jgi:hypothetical protein
VTAVREILSRPENELPVRHVEQRTKAPVIELAATKVPPDPGTPGPSARPQSARIPTACTAAVPTAMRAAACASLSNIALPRATRCDKASRRWNIVTVYSAQ